MPPVHLFSQHSRARARAVAVMMVTRRQLPARGRGSCATAIRSNNFAEGIFYGLARFARAERVGSDEHARSTGTLRDLHQRPVRRSVRQRVPAAWWPTSIVCWWRSGDARGAEHRRRHAGDNTTLDAKRRHRWCRRMMAADYATRAPRHDLAQPCPCRASLRGSPQMTAYRVCRSPSCLRVGSAN